ncbi:MAG: Zn-dependent hydrolase [Tissierellia bacterium]|nr:Zn-dependent hydrolase [Tissierellia bacterium]
MNFERFYENLNKFGKIGDQKEKGISRLAFSKEYYESIEMLDEYSRSKGFETKQDKVGNLFITYNPMNADKFLLIGSHMDTVKSGGLYDGAMGVIAALEVIESLKDNNITGDSGVIAVAFNAEEGSEMGGTFGSRTICNRNNLEDPELKNKISNYNLEVKDLEDCIINFNKIVGFLELHIEQGGVLENNKMDIGVVDGIVGITRYNITIKGEANHAGTTPMNLRNDPIRSLPEVINKLFGIASKYTHPFVMTIGDIRVKPGMYNIIPSEVEILIEVRDMLQDNIDEFFDKIKKFLENEIKDFDLVCNVEKPSVLLDKEYMEIVSKSCESLGYNYQVMSSGAGHDAKEISHLVPSSLIFVPSINGISHSPKEYTTPEHLKKGINVLYQSAISIIGGK